MTRKPGLILAVLLAAFMMVSGFDANAAKAKARVSFLSGAAHWAKTKKGPWKKLKKGQAVHDKWWVKTAADTRLELKLADKSVLRLAADTIIHLENLVYSKKKNKKVYKAKLVAGKAWARVTSLFGNDSSFEVKTRNAVAGVRGTVFRVDVAKDTSTLVRVYSGVVAVSNAPVYARKTKGGKRVEVAGPHEISRKQWEEYVAKAMQEVRVSAKGEISKPRAFTADEDKDDWVAWNQERDQSLP
ncbi:MAG: FecR domain-containing protein [Deltaproteobacteria bacterium]|nr:FecR domain-containing protein [Deltaproteobacteria bacterium]